MKELSIASWSLTQLEFLIDADCLDGLTVEQIGSLTTDKHTPLIRLIVEAKRGLESSLSEEAVALVTIDDLPTLSAGCRVKLKSLDLLLYIAGTSA